MRATEEEALLDEARRLLGQRRYAQAALLAKKAASEAATVLGKAESWVLLGDCCAATGDASTAYCVFASGLLACGGAAEAAARTQLPAAQRAALRATLDRLSSGRVEMLSALCRVPPPRTPLLQAAPLDASQRWQRLQARLACGAGAAARRRVFAVSDLHVDQGMGENLAWVRGISATDFANDVLIVAGDVGDTVTAVLTALRELKARFHRVVWVPGNHEAWLRDAHEPCAGPAFADSWAKLLTLLSLAEERCGVDTGPVEVVPGRLLVLPLLSWYHSGFDTEDPRPGRFRHDSFCNWGPVGEDAVWQVMLRLNAQALALAGGCVARAQQQQQRGRQQQQQQQQLVAPAGSSRVSWSTSGFLSVKGSGSRPVPGLQLNLGGRTPRQQQQQPAVLSAAPGCVAGGLGQQTGAGGTVQVGSAGPAAMSAPPQGATAALTVVTASHFLPHPALPHSRVSELAKAMGCVELQVLLDQVGSALHVYGHSHVCTDVFLPASVLDGRGPGGEQLAPEGEQLLVPRRRRYVQYALDAVGAHAAGLYCVWDGERLAAPGHVVRPASPAGGAGA